jgi:hypothetical protein
MKMKQEEKEYREASAMVHWDLIGSPNVMFYVSRLLLNTEFKNGLGDKFLSRAKDSAGK